MDGPGRDRSTRGAHPLAVLPPVAATLAVAGDVTTAQTAWVVGMTGVVVAELLARAADRRTATDGPDAPASTFLRWSVPLAPLLLGLAVLGLAPLAAATVRQGVTAGALAAVAVGVLLALPIPSARDLASRPATWRPRRPVPPRHLTGSRPLPGPRP